jgi:hypothetical protein
MLSQCATVSKEPESAPAATAGQVKTTAEVKAAGLPDDLSLLEGIAWNHPDQLVRAQAHLKLARLYASHKNEHPNYQRALEELELYLHSNPDDGRSDEIQDLLAVLSELARLSAENQKLRQKVNQLTKEKQELRDSVEKLKKLDIRMEQKRKQVK